MYSHFLNQQLHELPSLYLVPGQGEKSTGRKKMCREKNKKSEYLFLHLTLQITVIFKTLLKALFANVMIQEHNLEYTEGPTKQFTIPFLILLARGVLELCHLYNHLYALYAFSWLHSICCIKLFALLELQCIHRHCIDLTECFKLNAFICFHLLACS